MSETIFTKCETCDGTGEYPDYRPCYMCNGYGTVEKMITPWSFGEKEARPLLENRQPELIEPGDLME